MENNFKWDDNTVIDFVNWYIQIQGIDRRHTLENQTIVDSFKNGDPASLWNPSSAWKAGFKEALDNFETEWLDDYEAMTYLHYTRYMPKAGALEVIINNVEGDYSQLSVGLAKVAVKYDKYYLADDSGN